MEIPKELLDQYKSSESAEDFEARKLVNKCLTDKISEDMLNEVLRSIAEDFPFTFEQVKRVFEYIHSLDDTIRLLTYAMKSGVSPDNIIKILKWEKKH